VALNGALLALVVLTLAGFEVTGRPAAAVEASVRRYATAVSSSDLEAAMAEIAPDQRARWIDWVSGQLGNVYEVRGVAVRAPAPLERLLHHLPGGPTEVTVVIDVDRGFPDEFYQGTTTVTLEQSDGRWLLAAPLLATTE
jgi:hypothetical protein